MLSILKLLTNHSSPRFVLIKAVERKTEGTEQQTDDVTGEVGLL